MVMMGIERIWLADDVREDMEPRDGSVFVGIIEWSSDSAEDPAVTLARTVEDVEHWYARTVADALKPQDNEPEPPLPGATHAEVLAWMEEWREATTEAWLTVFRRSIPTGENVDDES